MNLKEKAKELVVKDLLSKLKKGDKEAEAELARLVAKEVDGVWPVQTIYIDYTPHWKKWPPVYGSPTIGGGCSWSTTICGTNLLSSNNTSLEIK